MHASVLEAHRAFSEPLEGRLPFLYLDSAEPRGLVTIGVGNLCPLSLAVTLPFCWSDGTPATREQIIASWHAVDARQDLKNAGGKHFAEVTRIRLTDHAIDDLVAAKVAQTEAVLRQVFPAFEDWCADAQMFALSWAWAVGPHARYPRMIAALNAGDFAGAVRECTINPQRGTIILRNERNRTLLRNAAHVQRSSLDPSVLYWPRSLADEAELPEPPSEPA